MSVFPGDHVETLGGKTGLVLSVDNDGYASVLFSLDRWRTLYGKNLKIISRMPSEAGEVLDVTFRLGGLAALMPFVDEGRQGEPGDSLRLLLVEAIMSR